MEYVTSKGLKETGIEVANDFLQIENIRSYLSTSVMDQARKKAILYLMKLHTKGADLYPGSEKSEVLSRELLLDEWRELYRGSWTLPKPL